MSEMESLLERVADDLAETYIADQGYEHAEFPNLSRVADKLLKRRLLPLLEAGERLYENCPIDALAVAWKSALAAAGKPAK